ncbi:hypothetical protein KUTeg_010875 [Tegillarca granosa]|uniref:Choline/carnitine acyltransferase domain-containing protein n=1 Tax=Tegillarca granosa TaxID=220873 RepID=A0ABQ9F7H1_TEGGR|nr:hypothetical protein KUTeg_010875 [Tegillarca granosa]
MAEARCAVHEPRVEKLETGHEKEIIEKDIFLAWRRLLVRRFFRTRNLLRNGMWPTSLWNLGVLVLILSVCMLWKSKLTQPLHARLWQFAVFIHIPKDVPDVLTAVFVSNEQPKTQSVSTLMWAVLVRIVSGYSPTLYSCQQSLPRMPVPSLKDTLNRLLDSLKPLYGEDTEEWNKLVQEAAKFEKTTGPKLQSILVLKSWWSQNFVTDWWEKYVYCMSRSPLPINSNYYIMDQSYWTPSPLQTARTASVIHQFLKFRQLCDREQLEPLVLRKTIPICMAQYEKMFSTTSIKAYSCLQEGYYYRMDVFDQTCKLMTPCMIEKQLQKIINDADLHQAAKCIPVLTGIERTTWSNIRSQHFCDGINKESLDVIEKAIFFVSLDTKINKDLSSRGKGLLHNDGKSLWFDKSINIVGFPDGRFGLNTEHSFADAPAVAHLVEFNLTKEILDCFNQKHQRYWRALEPSFTDKGHCTPQENEPPIPKSLQPSRLIWDVNPNLEKHILSALDTVSKNIDDLDLCIRDHDSYGKGFMKTCKVSPDAYIQMALQITYYKNAGKFALTYEASMTRLYLQGRTETVRSLTTDSVKAFLDKSESKETKINLLRKACEFHQGLYRDAMNGRGCDRHLFALYVVSKGMGYDSDFLKKALTIPWTLSTSQQPQQQIVSSPDCNHPQYRHMLCPGGGFGPVSDDGYGVSYMIPGDSKVFFHVSAKKSAPGTSATKFMDQLFETLAEMREIFVTENEFLPNRDFRKNLVLKIFKI